MTDTTQAPKKLSRNWMVRQAGGLIELVDRRITASDWVRRNMRKAVPNHWSFWLGYIALFALVAVLLSGVFLTLWFEPSMTPVTYDGAYGPLRGVVVSEAYASTLDLTFEVRGGLLMRQVHYWGTHIFIAATAIHLLRVFFTGAFRAPRKLNWLIGLGLLVLGIVGGYTGHLLPDDLLSGTSLRVVEAGALAIPIVGTYLSSFIFGGAFPGEDIIARLNIVHVLLVPALIAALLAVHLILVRRDGRTQWGGAGKTEKNIVGSPRVVHIARAAGLMLIVLGFIGVIAATVQINPVWLRGPSDPSQVSAGSQPDWYLAFLDGALRLMPPWEVGVFGHTLTLSMLVPAIVVPGLILIALAIYPWIEQKIVGTDRARHILDRPRNMPARTGLGVAFVVFYLLLWIAGGNDILATTFHVPVNWVTRFLQISIVLMPPLAYLVTKRICLGLQRRDRDKVLHGRETGITVVSPDGGFSEVHLRLSDYDVYGFTSHEPETPLDLGPEVDENGIPAPRQRWSKLRARLSKVYFGDVVGQPTATEIRAAAADRHSEHVPAAPASPSIGEDSQHEL